MPKFHVKDVNTREPLANALGSIFVEGIDTAIEARIPTNINGIAKGVGVSDSIRLISKIRIDVTNPYYFDSSTVVYHKLDDWIDYTEEERTIYASKT